MRDSGHPILLLVASDESATALSWESILIERFGGCDVLPAGELPELLFAGLVERQIVVLSQAALSEMDSTSIESIRGILESGLLVVLDLPTEAWAVAAGLRTVGRAALPVRWPETRWSVWGEGRSASQSTSPSALAPITPPPFDPGLEYLVQRPLGHGVRNVGTPMGLPAVWWKPEGQGGWISLSLPLAEFVEQVRNAPELEETQGDRWASAMVESTLDPNIFPKPLPRVWPRATPAAPGDDDSRAVALARGKVAWKVRDDGNGGYHIQILGASGAAATELAMPLDWRGQVLADWNTDWTGARSRKVLGPRRAWRLIATPAGPGLMNCSYRPVQNSSPWR